ncbi:MAG: hypothetical protein K9J13_10170 [Saprospiraceae bacterium]|nr:hypothetical protein [Saprospiraceae bacterium]
MKVVRLLFILLIINSTISSYSQTPGYQGRRLILGYSNFLSLRTNYLDVVFFSEPVLFYRHHIINTEFILSKRISIGLRAEYMKLPIPDGEHLTFDYLFTNKFGNTDPMPIDYYPDDVEVLSIGLDFFLYRKNYIAPVGRFHRFGLLYSKYNNQKFFDKMPQEIYIDRSVKQYNTYSLTYTVGRKKIIFNNIYYSIGARFGLGLNDMMLKGIFDNYHDAGKNENFNFERMTTISINQSMNFGIDFSIGLLAPRISNKNKKL